MSEQKNNTDTFADKFAGFISKYIVQIFIAVCIAVMFAPFLLTRSYLGFASQQTGFVGDTVGGLTAPIIGLFSALLVYVAFKEQVKANEELQKFNKRQSHIVELQNVFYLLDNIDRLNENIVFKDESSMLGLKNEYNGLTAVQHIINVSVNENEIRDNFFYNANIVIVKNNIFKLYDYLEMAVHEIDISSFDTSYKLTLMKSMGKYAFNQSILELKVIKRDLPNLEGMSYFVKEFYDSAEEILKRIKRFYMLYESSINNIINNK